ncbi:MAG: glycosyltransferase family 61 protein [Caldimonas sp.]
MLIEPFLGRACRKLGIDADYRKVAKKRWLVEPASTTQNRPAIFDMSALPRVTGVAPDSTYEFQLERLTRAVTHHPPTYAYQLVDVVMAQGNFFKWNMVYPIVGGRMPAVGAVDSPEIAAGVLATTYLGNKFFGHWLIDDVPLSKACAGMGTLYGHVGTDNVLSAHQQEYSRLLDYRVDHLHDAFFRELVILDQRHETASKAANYRWMRDAIRAGRKPRTNPGVMILRRASGIQRVLLNEDEIAEVLASRGFTIVDPMVRSVAEVIDDCLDARVVIGVEGSALAHGFFSMDPSGTLFTLQPTFKFDHFWRDRCDCVGTRYAVLLGDAAEGGFRIDPHELLGMLDALPEVCLA